MINNVSKSMSKSRNTLSQTVVLAQKYGGLSCKRAASAVLKKDRPPRAKSLE